MITDDNPLLDELVATVECPIDEVLIHTEEGMALFVEAASKLEASVGPLLLLCLVTSLCDEVLNHIAPEMRERASLIAAEYCAAEDEERET